MTQIPGLQDEHQALQRSLKELADLKLALDESAIVAITDASGVITYVNDTFCKIAQYDREELIGQTHRIVNSGQHPKKFFKELWQVIASGGIWRGEICNRAKDGSLYWVDTTIVPFLDETTGKPYQYIAIRKDISYLKRIENELRLLNEGLEARVQERTVKLETANQELQATLERLQESERMRETFISALTHDLRTPLVAERRALDLLHSYQGQLPPSLSPLTERLIKNNDDLLGMVTKLLEIYQYEAGKIRLWITEASLHTLVAECFETLQPLAEGKHIQMMNRVPTKLEVLSVDTDQLKRLLTNLLANAIQNMTGEQGEIVVTASELGHSVEFRVIDNGPGIDPAVMPYLFERYFSLQQVRKQIGSGLGLSICKMIAKLHGGAIRAESELGRGTEFIITLPR